MGEALRDTRLDVRHRQLAHKVIEIRDTGARLFPGEVNIYFIVLQLLVWCIFSAKSESDSVRGECIPLLSRTRRTRTHPVKILTAARAPLNCLTALRNGSPSEFGGFTRKLRRHRLDQFQRLVENVLFFRRDVSKPERGRRSCIKGAKMGLMRYARKAGNMQKDGSDEHDNAARKRGNGGLA